MFRNACCACLSLGSLFVLCGASPVPAPFDAKVAGVVAGDLISIEHGGTQQEIRLWGVDCPEPEQAFAQETLAFVRQLLTGKTVRVEIRAVDTLEKPVALISLPDQKPLNALLIEQGYGWWDSKNLPEEKPYKKLMAKAITATAGLWKDPTALSPWDFRKSHLIPDYAYGQKEAEEVAVAVEEKKEAKLLSAKGDAVYRGNTDMAAAGEAGDSAAAGAGAADRFKEIEQQFNNLDPMDLIANHSPRIATDASGKPLGLTADNISGLPGASLLGLQDGDIIAGINGQAITSEAQVLGMASQFKNQKHFDVQVIRGGETINIPVTIP